MNFSAGFSSSSFDTAITHLITVGLIACCMIVLARIATSTLFFADNLESSSQDVIEEVSDEIQEHRSGFRPASELLTRPLKPASDEARSVAGIEQPTSADRTF